MPGRSKKEEAWDHMESPYMVLTPPPAGPASRVLSGPLPCNPEAACPMTWRRLWGGKHFSSVVPPPQVANSGGGKNCLRAQFSHRILGRGHPWPFIFY